VARPFDRDVEIAREINRSPYGLAAAVWSADPERARRVRDALRVGVVYLNCHGAIPRNAPWGGFRLSGVGRLYGRDGLYAFTEARQSYEQGAP
jgi:betaine-aldehyde dehydrogenase